LTLEFGTFKRRIDSLSGKLCKKFKVHGVLLKIRKLEVSRARSKAHDKLYDFASSAGLTKKRFNVAPFLKIQYAQQAAFLASAETHKPHGSNGLHEFRREPSNQEGARKSQAPGIVRLVGLSYLEIKSIVLPSS
jgi:hypothetical protein